MSLEASVRIILGRDCHSPQITGIFQLSDYPGLSAYLTDDIDGVSVVLYYLALSPS